MIVVSGDDDDLGALAKRLAEDLEDRARHLERVADRSLAQLDDVPEENDPVGRRHCVTQCLQRRLVPHDIPA